MVIDIEIGGRMKLVDVLMSVAGNGLVGQRHEITWFEANQKAVAINKKGEKKGGARKSLSLWKYD